MTDGIIQEEYSRIRSIIQQYAIGQLNLRHCIANIENSEQELIEKIKQEFQAYHYNESGLSFHEIRKILIGDNQ